ncbi:uncharacterized protein PHACADRAFT_253272 [Phanerochaete carnosa HHB-10118-sp]|uniref:Uncharacterized protein n=1 Tax=Phanerochaete carnosa (strain HHB-10118-sp) TaxID=650164 RepID=K5X0F5_PHACS|nr:uncharacterized protein PHACADRAFT_253272 [Phanerochaete carnosa HHB-10118-sp]EKM56247.1 hypothetical protein PHACADRAFT_253272 [Phanerochaete carnosa HHB-10118-sp]
MPRHTPTTPPAFATANATPVSDSSTLGKTSTDSNFTNSNDGSALLDTPRAASPAEASGTARTAEALSLEAPNEVPLDVPKMCFLDILGDEFLELLGDTPQHDTDNAATTTPTPRCSSPAQAILANWGSLSREEQEAWRARQRGDNAER